MSTAGDLQLRAALVGDMDKEMSAALDLVERSLAAAVFEYAAEGQTKWRADIQGSGLANAAGLARTIRLNKYRNKGLDPAALIYSKFPVIQHAFEAETVVRARKSRYLAIPNPQVWPGGRARRPRRTSGQDFDIIATAEKRFGPLQFVHRPGKAALLVAQVRQSAARPGTFRRASDTARRTGRGLVSVVVFFLVREGRLPRMLRGSVIRERIGRNAPASIDRLYVRNFERAAAGPALLEGPSG